MTSTPTARATVVARGPARSRPRSAPFPPEGGHVTVRVVGFEERSQDLVGLRADLLGRLHVILVHDAEHVAVTSTDGAVLGHLPTTWVRIVGRELQRFELAGVQPLVRATLTGARGDRDLCVLLAWPRSTRAD